MGALSVALLLVLATAAEEPRARRRLVVAELAPVGVAPELAQQATEVLAAACRALPGYTVLGKAELRAIADFQGDAAWLDCRSEECAAELAERSRGELVLLGTVGALGKESLLSLRLLDGAGVIVRRAAAAGAELEALAARLARELTGDGARPAEAPAPASPLAPMRLAVLDLSAHGVSEALAQSLGPVVARELAAATGATVVSQEDIRRLLEAEAQKQLLGCDATACFAELGAALGVPYLVTGQVGLVGETLAVQLQLLDTAQLTTAGRAAEIFTGAPSQLLDAARVAARALVGRAFEGTGKLVVRAAADEARLSVDGREAPLGQAQEVRLGKHSVRLDAPDHRPWMTELYVLGQEPLMVDAELLALPAPWYRTWWVWTGAAVVAAGVGAGVYFATRDETASLRVAAPAPLAVRLP